MPQPQRRRHKPHTQQTKVTTETVREGLAAKLPITEIAKRCGVSRRVVYHVIEKARKIHGLGWPFLDLVPPRPKPTVAQLEARTGAMTPEDMRRIALTTLVQVAETSERDGDRVAAATALLRVVPVPASTPVAVDADLLAEVEAATKGADTAL